MVPEKILYFIGSKEYNEIIEDIGNFLGINWENEKMPSIINLIDDLIRYKKFGDKLRPTIQKWLNFLEEEKIDVVETYLRDKYQDFAENLWQEAEKEEREKITEEFEEKTTELTFEEKEKKYLDLMKRMYNLEPKPKKQKEEAIITTEEKGLVNSIPSKETVKVMEITNKNQPQDLTVSWKKIEENTEPTLPKGTIIIKKGEDKEIEKGEEFLDLSRL